tara:strand:- start:1175 stop:1951 length:777 start_codon:yes stop_codon:yes gene_type:complete
MITVKFIGGARKSFDTDEVILEKNNLTIDQLLEYLISTKPESTASFDGNNLLIAVNGIDSSALDGNETILNDNDVVNIIPIIHGGASSRIQLKVFSTNIEIFEMKKTLVFDNESLNKLRTKFPNLVIQAISSKFLLNKSHIKKIISLSLLAKKQKIMLSKKIETDILLRFAGTTQINYAIEKAGLNSKTSFCIIALGKKNILEKLHIELGNSVNKTPLKADNSNFLKKYFKISKKHIDSIDSNFSLEDLLVERSSVLT